MARADGRVREIKFNSMNIEATLISLTVNSITTSVVELAKQNMSPLIILSSTEGNEYPKTLNLELVEFYDKSKFWIPGQMILSEAAAAGCNGGKKLAGILLDNQEQLPKEWERYVLVFPGTVWTPETANSEGLTILSKDPGEQWNIGFIGIGGFNAPKDARFVKVVS